jgi:hypothetical protein
MENEESWFDDKNQETEKTSERNFIPVEQLNEEDLGALFFSEEQVALILCAMPDSFSKRVLKGQLTSAAKVRQMIVAQAIGGSSEAQKIIEKWILKINLDSI